MDSGVFHVVMTYEMYSQLSPEERHAAFFEMISKQYQGAYIPVPINDPVQRVVGYNVIPVGVPEVEERVNE